MPTHSLAHAIDALLPQTQCTRCGYTGCQPYADAIAASEADINQCPPGGDAGIAALAQLLGRAVIPLNPVHGSISAPTVAVIDEATCIGCAKCIAACPVDAIIGARKLMHTVFSDWCTGCALCIPPCPVDCITLTPSGGLPPPDVSRERYAARNSRRERDEQLREARLAALDTQLDEDA